MLNQLLRKNVNMALSRIQTVIDEGIGILEKYSLTGLDNKLLGETKTFQKGLAPAAAATTLDTIHGRFHTLVQQRI